MHHLWLLVLVSSCTPRVPMPTAVGPSIAPPQNLFLRNAFDQDPSHFLGRFVPTGATVLDESSAMPLTCSKHVSYRKVAAGGVTYDEVFTATSEAAARVGVPLVAQASGGGSRSATIRVQYTLVDKLVADVADPAAFESCCKVAPDQCTDRYVSEFLGGTGSVFYATDYAVSAGGDGVTPEGVKLGLDVKHGIAWQRSITFEQPVYFAFKTTPTAWGAPIAGGCGDWTQAPPRSSQGRYFVGLSKPLPTEQEARTTALRDGREQVVRYVAERVETGSIEYTVTTGKTTSLSADLEDEKLLQTSAGGVARLVKDEAWCVEPTATPGGDVYVAKVLMFLPRSEETAAAAAVVGAVDAKKR